MIIIWQPLGCQSISVGASMEADYVNNYCPKMGGETEVVLWDRTRVDCLTDDRAIEFDWCSKWAEAIGQALYYAKVTGKAPAVVLICSPGEERFQDRFRLAAPGVELVVIDR